MRFQGKPIIHKIGKSWVLVVPTTYPEDPYDWWEHEEWAHAHAGLLEWYKKVVFREPGSLCPTRCDSDCDDWCHEEHDVPYKRAHLCVTW